MSDYIQAFAEVFVPLFAVMNVLPVLPIVIAALEELPRARRGRTMRQAFLTAAGASVAICLAGGAFLSWLGVELEDFRIAGGIILLVFAVHDLLFSRVERKKKAADLDEEVFGEGHPEGEEEGIGVVPLGIPILFGPAGMTALVVYSQTAEPPVIYSALALNLLLNGLLLWRAGPIASRLGKPFLRAMGKIMGVVLASLAVSMLRVGILSILRGV